MTITANNFETLTHSHFLSACESNNLKSIQRLLTEGCCIDEVDPHGMTGLMMASAAGHIHTVKANFIWSRYLQGRCELSESN